MRVLWLLLIAALPFGAHAAQAPVDLILTNGQVFTRDPARPMVEAVAISGERIVQVGTASEVAALAGETHAHDRPAAARCNARLQRRPHAFRTRSERLRSQLRNERTDLDRDERCDRRGGSEDAAGHVDLRAGRLHRGARRSRSRAPRSTSSRRIIRCCCARITVTATSPTRKRCRCCTFANDEPDPAGGYYERVAGFARNQRTLLGIRAVEDHARVGERAVTDDEIVAALRELPDAAVRAGITSLQIFPAMPLERFVRLADEERSADPRACDRVLANDPVGARSVGDPRDGPPAGDRLERDRERHQVGRRRHTDRARCCAARRLRGSPGLAGSAQLSGARHCGDARRIAGAAAATAAARGGRQDRRRHLRCDGDARRRQGRLEIETAAHRTRRRA